jgi:dolichol kinase
MYLSFQLRWLFLAVLGFGVILSLIQERRKLPVISWFLDRYDKTADEVPGQGPLTFFLGSVVVWFLFPADYAIIAIVVLAFGDPMAYMFGMIMKGPGLPWNREKTWAGLVGFMLVPGILVTLLFGPFAALIAVISGGIAETLCLPERVLTDDNFLVPTTAAAALWIISLFVPVV